MFTNESFSLSVLQSVPGANNCGFAPQDPGTHCHFHCHGHYHYHCHFHFHCDCYCDFTLTKPICQKWPFREVAVFGKDDNLVTSFTNPGFLFPCSIAFCPEKREAFILDKRYWDSAYVFSRWQIHIITHWIPGNLSSSWCRLNLPSLGAFVEKAENLDNCHHLLPWYQRVNKYVK